MSDRDPADLSGAVAILGMAGRFPGARDLHEFWRNLEDGRESISFFSREELSASGAGLEAGNPRYVPAWGVIEDEELFDPAFFHFSPREAQITDPQHRLFLECSWEALERAGYGAGTHGSPVGVFAAAGRSGYRRLLEVDADLVSAMAGFPLEIATENEHLASRVAYKLDLRGPCLVVQTACSSALVAVHLACLSLAAHECDLALAGGVSLRLPQRLGYLWEAGGISSPDGHTRSFDARAQGTVGGNGVGVVVLKRLTEALADRDPIRAVIRGSAMNNDGSGRVGYTSPGGEGQAEVILAAQSVAGVDAETISYVEAHGSATPIGDPIEVAALTRAFRTCTARQGFCALGSVKSNIGHLREAAGIAGLIKTVLALEHGVLPPSLHYQTPNPEIELAQSPFHVNTARVGWPRHGETPRRAGVSSFGLGGTNAHVVLEEAPAPPPTDPAPSWQLLVWSARDAAALHDVGSALVEHLAEQPGQDLADVSYTLQVGRRAWRHRAAVVARDREDAVDAIRSGRRVLAAADGKEDRPVAFMIEGMGDEYPGMGAGLYETEPVFRRELSRACEILEPLLGFDLRRRLLSSPLGAVGADTGAAPRRPDLRHLLRRQDAAVAPDRLPAAHAASFVLAYAQARLWESWGVRPQALIGYSLGEYVAACLAGVVSLEDALRLVVGLPRLIEDLPPGGMLTVAVPAEELPAAPGVSVAVTAGPGLCVVAGPEGALAELEEQLRRSGAAFRRLSVERALHSPAMEPIAMRLAELACSVTLRPPNVPYVSNVTGRWITAEDAMDPGYWARHLCSPVRFAEGLQTLTEDSEAALLELGPGAMLAGVAMWQAGLPVASSLGAVAEGLPERAALLTAAAKLWLAGVRIDWQALRGGERRARVPLPSYPFQRQRFGPACRAMAREEAPGPGPRDTAREIPPSSGDEVEGRIAALFAAALGLAQVGDDQSFFELGGTSIIGLRMLSILGQELGLHLPMPLLYETQTIAALARAVKELRSQP